MTRKTYISRHTVPHFSVGGNRRVAFTPMSNGNSFFSTDDKSLQQAMEKHPWYRKKFMLHRVEEDTATDAPESKATGGKKELTEKHFDTLADAKTYLAQEFGTVRSNIKTIESAISIGKANGVNIIFDNNASK